MEKIFRVIKIIDEYQIVVNGGSNDFIKEDDKLEIFIPGEPIIDPETTESLGALDYIKARVKVSYVAPKFCICQSIDNAANVAAALTKMTIPVFAREIPLLIDPLEISGGYEAEDKTIRIGDSVRKLRHF